jgi:hypothetical protein
MGFVRYKKIFSIILIFVHLVTMVITIDAHSDLFSNTKSSLPSIVSHDCGAKEIHKDIDTKDHCLPCFRSHNSTSNSEFSPYLPDTGIERSLLAYVDSSPSLVTSSYTANRGPPSYHTAV